MKIRFILVLSVLIFVPAWAGTPQSGKSAADDARMVEIVLDASGSMAGKLASGEPKMEAAKKAVADLASKLPGTLTLAFRAYGHQSAKDKHDCRDTQLLVPFGPLAQGKDTILALSGGLQAKGYTPITFVLQKAAEDFPPSFGGERMIILVSDGIETCEGDPCATAKALDKANPKILVHTVGFGVDEAARSQLDCIARATGGTYFGAADAGQLIAALSQAIRTASVVVVEKKGTGWLEVKGAHLHGHAVTEAESGKLVETASSTRSTVPLPSGLYNVAFGKALWKSVEVKAGETTVLEPGWISMVKASLNGHDIVDPETGAVHGTVSSLDSTATLIPGRYLVMFGSMSWEVEVKGGRESKLNPGTVTVKRADYRGHKIFNAAGDVVGSVSNIMSSMPLPPGEYAIEIGGRRIPFSLKEGEDIEFDNKDAP